MKRVMAVTAATIMAMGASAYLSCTDIRAAADTESFEYSEIVSENEEYGINFKFKIIEFFEKTGLITAKK